MRSDLPPKHTCNLFLSLPPPPTLPPHKTPGATSSCMSYCYSLPPSPHSNPQDSQQELFTTWNVNPNCGLTASMASQDSQNKLLTWLVGSGVIWLLTSLISAYVAILSPPNSFPGTWSLLWYFNALESLWALQMLFPLPKMLLDQLFSRIVCFSHPWTPIQICSPQKSFLPWVCLGASLPQHYWHLRQNRSLLWGPPCALCDV